MTKKPTREDLLKEVRRLKRECTGYKKAAARLSLNEMIISCVREPMCLVAPDYTCMEANTAYLAFLGKERDEVVGHKIPDLLGEDVFSAKVRYYLDRALKGNVERYEETFQYPPGAGWRNALVSYYPLMGEDGSVLGIVSTAHDITERKEAEKALKQSYEELEVRVRDRTATLTRAIEHLEYEVGEREKAEEDLRVSEEKFSRVFQASPDLLAITSLDEGVYLDVNDSFLRSTGYSMHEVIGRSSLDLKIWENPIDRQRIIDKLLAQGVVRNHEIRQLTKAGEVRTMLNSSELIELGGRKFILSTSRDITERKRLEEELRRTQKMEAVGRLAGGIAHDFNNLLTAIDGYCEIALLKTDAPDEVHKNLMRIKEVKNNASSLIRQILGFSRKQELKPQLLDLNGIVENMKTLLQRFLGGDIGLRLDLDEDIGLVWADQGQIEQVIMNLSLNARDAMPDGGDLSIATSRALVGEESQQMHADLKAGEYVRLVMSDTGAGMDDDTRSHIFEPFFSTKEEGKGTGLGLTTVYGIVKQCGGAIAVTSDPGRGSVFEIFLPKSAQCRAGIPGKPGRERPSGETDTILLVENNIYVRDMTFSALKSYGYNIMQATDAIEALKLCDASEQPVDLLITDVVLPRMNGPQLAERLVEKYPGMAVLYISGYPDEVVSLYGVSESVINLLHKPFSASELANTVREALSDKGRR